MCASGWHRTLFPCTCLVRPRCPVALRPARGTSANTVGRMRQGSRLREALLVGRQSRLQLAYPAVGLRKADLHVGHLTLQVLIACLGFAVSQLERSGGLSFVLVEVDESSPSISGRALTPVSVSISGRGGSGWSPPGMTEAPPGSCSTRSERVS